jgi:hypothetical protein
MTLDYHAVEQLTVQVAQDGYQKLAGRKSQSGNQMRLEADYGGALNSGNVYFRNGKIMLPVSQPCSWYALCSS